MTGTPSRYAFEPRLHGLGGFGKIIKGHDNALQRDIAVKVLVDDKGVLQHVDRERFRREARILARLTHPNIPAIYDVVFDDDAASLLIIFQFVEGRNLRQVLAEEQKCQLAEVRAWFRQLSSAIDYAHGKGVVHRDIKPDNIIITPDRQTAYLVDFGIALSSQDATKLTEYGYAIGTPGYMSPEQQSGKETDHRTDVYSLAVTLYECLAGKPISVGDYEELAKADEAIPPSVDELIQSCLVPADRRIENARVFGAKLASTGRVTKPLSEILAHGRLHEVTDALESFDADEFANLPKGQQTLVLLRCEDVVSSGSDSLRSAGISFLETLLRIGLHLPPDDFRQVVQPAIDWGFEREAFGRRGNWALQEALTTAAAAARKECHSVIASELIRALDEVKLLEKPNWYLQALRQLLSALLANQSCDEHVPALGVLMREVNKVQRARS